MIEWLTPPGVPNSVPHMVVGFTSIIGTGVLYIALLAVRYRKLRGELHALEEWRDV